MDRVLIVGGTSKVGRVLAADLVTSRPVRVMTRNPASPVAGTLADLGIEIVAGDLLDRPSVEGALRNVGQVVASAHGFPGTSTNNVETVDLRGHLGLIDAATAARVRRFLYISAVGAGPDVPVDLYRAKWSIEQALTRSPPAWTSLRATAFMDFWAAFVGEPAVRTGRATVFGRGENPINFVAAADVAHLAAVLLDDATTVDQIVEIGGPENLSMNEVVHRFAAAANRPAKIRHVPRPMMRLLAATAGRVNKPLGRQIAAGLLMDTGPMSFDPGPTLARWPMELTPLATLIGRTLNS